LTQPSWPLLLSSNEKANHGSNSSDRIPKDFHHQEFSKKKRPKTEKQASKIIPFSHPIHRSPSVSLVPFSIRHLVRSLKNRNTNNIHTISMIRSSRIPGILHKAMAVGAMKDTNSIQTVLLVTTDGELLGSTSSTFVSPDGTTKESIESLGTLIADIA
jgi:hypothetical protein